MELQRRTSRFVVVALGVSLALTAHASRADAMDCHPDYDATGWVPAPTVDPTPGAETCVGYPDKFGRYHALGVRFDPDRTLLLLGDFAVARYELYIVDFFDARDRFLHELSVTLDDLDPRTGETIIPRAGSCNPAAVRPPASAMPSSCWPRSFAIAIVHESRVEEVETIAPDVNVIGVPDEAAKVTVVRRVFLEDPDFANDPPAPLWCAGEHCVSLASVTPGVRFGLDDPAADITAERGRTPPDPCFGSRPGTCTSPLPFYRTESAPDRWVGANYETRYLSARLSNLGREDVVVVSRPLTPVVSSRYPQDAALRGDDNVRYLSFCLAYSLFTITLDCLHDGDLSGAREDARIVVGPRDRLVVDPRDGAVRSFAAAVRLRGDAPLGWGPRWRGWARRLTLRSTLVDPDWPGDPARVPRCDVTDPDACVPASSPPPEGIGPWAPIGRHCTVNAYLNGEESCDAR